MSNPNASPELQNGAPAPDEAPNGAPEGAAAPEVQPPQSPKKSKASKVDEPILDEVTETGVRVMALVEVSPGQFAKRFVTGVTDDRRVLATDNVEAASPMNTAAARELLKNPSVRNAFPTAQIIGA